MHPQRWAIASLLALFLASASSWAASPSLGGIGPRGVQRGSEATLTFSGARLGDAKEVLFYTPGVEVKKLEVVNDAQVKATVPTPGRSWQRLRGWLPSRPGRPRAASKS